MKALIQILLLLPLALKMCVSQDPSGDRVRLAKAGGEIVYLDEALQGMPEHLSSKDSAAYVAAYVKERVKEILVYEQASRNIPQSSDIDKLVENYRRSLILYEYQQQVMQEKMQSEISDTEVEVFYQNNLDRFVTGRDLIQGLYVKIPKAAPGLEKFLANAKKASDEEISNIETYCVQNAGQFEYFADRWVRLEEILEKIPHDFGSTESTLRSRSSLQVTEGDFTYLLKVKDYVLAGNAAPFEYVKDEARNILANSRKTEFIHRFEQDMMDEAVRKKKVIYY